MPTTALSPSGSKSPEKRASLSLDKEKTKDSQIDFFLNDFTETGSVRVGKDYQAVIPQYVGSPGPTASPSDERSILLWSPPENLSESEYYEYTVVAGKEYKYSLEQALGFLQWHNHDVKSAIKELAQYVPVSDDWSVEDILVFEQAFAFNGKCFNRIQQMLPNKTMASLVKFYYSWKKRTTKDFPSSIDHCDKRKLISDDEDEINSETSEKRRNHVNNLAKYCKNCRVSSEQLYSSPNGKLCNTCFIHFRRTGALREVTAKRRPGQELVEQPDTDPENQRNHKAPKNMNLNLNDFMTIAQKFTEHRKHCQQQRNVADLSFAAKNSDSSSTKNIGHEDTSQPSTSSSTSLLHHYIYYDFNKDKDNDKMMREIKSHRDRAAKNSFTLSQMRKRLNVNNNSKCSSTTDTNPLNSDDDISLYRVPARLKPAKPTYKWSHHEILLALQGFRMFGKNFHNISELMGTKTADHVKTFYTANRNKYEIDSLITELEQQKKEEKIAKDTSVIVVNESDDEKDTEIVLIDD